MGEIKPTINPPIPKPGQQLPVQPPKPLLLMAGHTVVNAVRPSLQAVSNSAQTVSSAVSNLHAKTPPSRRWLLWLIGVLILLGVGGGAYWYLYGNKTAPKLSKIVPFVRTSDVIPRNSNIPTGTLTFKDGQLTPTISNLEPTDSAYTLAIQLTKKETGAMVVYGAFSIDSSEGKLLDEHGVELTGIAVEDITGFDQASIILNPTDPEKKEAVVLTGDMPASGKTVEMRFPYIFKNSVGIITSSFDQELAEYKLDLELENLPDVSALGWKYTAWLVNLDGPYLSNLKSLGSFFPSKNGGANHSFTTQDKIADFDTLVVSLEPADDSDQQISPIRVFSALIDLN